MKCKLQTLEIMLESREKRLVSRKNRQKLIPATRRKNHESHRSCSYKKDLLVGNDSIVLEHQKHHEIGETLELYWIT